MTAKERMGIALTGGVPDRVPLAPYLSSPEVVRDMVGSGSRSSCREGGYIMDGSKSLVYETPVENARAVTEAGREFGVYT